jgi:DNA-binding CsgD family transcriptional regulator
MVRRLGYNVLSSSRSASPSLRQAKTQGAFSLRLVNQRSAQRNNKTISHDRRAIDRGIPNHQIAPHHDCDPRFTERSSSMPGWKLATLISGTATPTSKDRELPPFVGSLLARWEPGHASDRSTQSGSRVGDTLTARECDVLAMISQGFSNKQTARTLEISPETVKTHVKRIFLKLAVNTRTEAVYRAASLGLLGLDGGDGHGPSRKQQADPGQGKSVQEVPDRA